MSPGFAALDLAVGGRGIERSEGEDCLLYVIEPIVKRHFRRQRLSNLQDRKEQRGPDALDVWQVNVSVGGFTNLVPPDLRPVGENLLRRKRCRMDAAFRFVSVSKRVGDV